MDNTNNLANVVLTVVEEWEKVQYGMCCADAVHKLDIAREELAVLKEENRLAKVCLEELQADCIFYSGVSDGLQAQLNVIARDRSFYKSCALSGEVPKDGDEPSAREITG